jgi:hypothetical protein
MAICAETGDAQAREVFLLNVGVVYPDRGDWDRASDTFAENLSFARANHDDLDVAMSSENLWEAHLIGGEPDKAAAGQRGHLVGDLAEYHRHGQRAVEQALALVAAQRSL